MDVNRRQTMSEQPTFDLNRENNIDSLVDATGKKWNIHVNKQNGLCTARPEPDREGAVIPKEFAGQWTKPSLLKPVIQTYVTKTWDMADAADVKAERKREAAREYQKKDDSGSKDK
jgi:hypothetical protein